MEDDPAADFLAREQSELAGLEDDNVNGSPAPEADDFGGLEGEVPENTEIQNGDFGDDMGGFDSNDTDGLNDQSSGYNAISQQDTVRVEPEQLKIWREEQKERLEKKDIAEAKKKDEWQATAKKELEDWYKHHAEQLAKTKDNNIVAEKAFIKDRDVTVAGHEWEKICALCEFNPKVNKTTKDITRMRALLLQLKQSPLVR